jgi:hypothetical protein
MNRLDLLVGPNGAGKSTSVELTLAPLLPGSVFVNADEVAKQRWPEDPTSHAYDAARIAADGVLPPVKTRPDHRRPRRRLHGGTTCPDCPGGARRAPGQAPSASRRTHGARGQDSGPLPTAVAIGG